MLNLQTPVSQLFMVGPSYVNKLKRLNIKTIGDLLFHLPHRYENYSLVSKINELQPGEKITVIGTITHFENIYTKYGKKIQKVKIADETGEIEITWYNQPFLRNVLKTGIKVALAGEVKWFGHKLVMEAPEYEIIRPTIHPRGDVALHPWGGNNLIHTANLVPIYPETEGLSSKWLRSRINSVLTKLSVPIPEILLPTLLSKFNLIGRREAIYKVHFPKNWQEAVSAKKRLSFDELLTLQLVANERKKQMREKIVGHQLSVKKYQANLDQLIQNLSFELTQSQEKALAQILVDLGRDKPMNRLLEGDVGSGKTVVAAVAMYLTYLNGFKSVLLAPTEILANQHFDTISKLLKPYNIKLCLLTANTKIIYSSSEHKRVEKFSTGSNNTSSIDIFVGTHSLLSEKLHIDKLALVVIDEQQRFGVRQRAILREKGDNPHVLILTATPIPRTIALTLYADLDLSVLEEMPEGRQKIKTWVVPTEKREAAYKWIQKQIEDSRHTQQAFIICPLIEDSETLETVKAAKTEYERLKSQVFPTLRLGLLHGRLKAKEKEKIMAQLTGNKLDILVSTPVVEVGIDIATATVMMIEAADRFGLAQLHQLRGRVGRSDLASYCLLFTESDKPEIIDRLKILEKVFSGPKLAEYDLKLRGIGEIFGTKQHGHFGTKIADLTDLVLIEETKAAANMLTAIDPKLSKLPLLKAEVGKYTIEKIAPD